jgi:hypothetical protein
MKKIAFFGFVIFIAFFCVSASVWEGAASVSLNGELPEEGYYAATRSFPRNTLVDVTNLETGQTIRVIVASGLDSPGLLAILSKDAAGAIGLHARFIGRIRMTMPSEPVGFSRFTEKLDSSGDPDFDPAAAIAAAKDSGFDVQQAAEAMKKNPVKASDPAPDNTATNNPAVSEPAPSADKPVSPTPKPPIAPNPAAFDIVDLPEFYTLPQIKTKDDPAKSEYAPVPPRTADTATAAGVYGYTPEPPIPPDTSNISQVYPPGYKSETSKPEPEAVTAQTTRTETPKPEPEAVTAQTARTETVPTVITLIPAEQRPPESSSYAVLPPEAEIAPLEEPGADYIAQSDLIPGEYIIPPVEEMPSAVVAQIEPELKPIIPLIEKTVSSPIEKAVSSPVEKTVSSPPEVIIDVKIVETHPILSAGENEPLIPPAAPPKVERAPRAERAPELKAEPEKTPEPKAEPEKTPEPKVEPEKTPEPKAEPKKTPEPKVEPEKTPEPRAEPKKTPEPKAEPEKTPEPKVEPKKTPEPKAEKAAGFSIPVIDKLEKGKYYLQLAAFTLPDLVETELLKISTVYPLAVQESGSAEKPLYRILIGPINSGESGALLQRFKTAGYRDAFIRKED